VICSMKARKMIYAVLALEIAAILCMVAYYATVKIDPDARCYIWSVLPPITRVIGTGTTHGAAFESGPFSLRLIPNGSKVVILKRQTRGNTEWYYVFHQHLCRYIWVPVSSVRLDE
jgi:hypothetical protein